MYVPDPCRIETFARSGDLDLHFFRRDAFQFAEQTIAETAKESRATGQNDVLVERSTQVHVRALNRAREDLVDTFALFADQLRIEQNLGCSITACTELESIAS